MAVTLFYTTARGLVLAKLGRYKEAIKCYDKAIELDGMNTSAPQQQGNDACKDWAIQGGFKVL